MTDVTLDAFPEPSEIDGFWTFDKMHAPRPITPLSEDLVTRPLAEGFTTAQAMYDSPVAVTNRHVNYYLYASFHPLTDESELADRLTRYRDTLEARVPDVGRRWVDEWEPRIVADNLAEKATDYSTMDTAQLLARLDELKDRMTFLWHVHGHINFVLISSAAFSDLYDEIMEPDDPTEAYQALQGFETQSLKASRGLWALSRQVRGNPALVRLFEENQGRDLEAALGATEAGAAFLDDLRAYLDEFGWRSDAVYDLGDVTWRERPSIPLNALASYIGLDDDADPDVLHARASENRERLLAAARAEVAGDPERAARFERLYEAARYSNPLTENHAFWIDQMGVTLFRRFVQHLGQRLADGGVLRDPSDVHFLTEAELRESLADGADHQAEADRRRAEHRAAAAISPPPALGTPRESAEDPFMDALRVRLLGVTPPDESAEDDPDVLEGVAGAPGVVTGTVKVVRSLEEASILEDGDIMVCEMTLPPWVPLFSVVSGVVADTGGVLSHCAIVARDLELPAVVGTRVGTSVLANGMTVTVDGTRGIVTIDARP
jgi:pyruvate,water dikinase